MNYQPHSALSRPKGARSTLLRVVAVAAFSFSAATLLSCQKKDSAPTESQEIVIGEYGSMTGATATFGQSTHNGILLAIDSLNSTGGVLGKKIRVVSEDDQGKPEEAITVITKLINKDRVSAILGEIASSNSLAGAPVCQRAKIPMVSPGSTNPKVTQIGDFIFRVCFIDPFQGTVMAKFTANNLKLTQVAILRDIKSDYSVGLADFFEKSFTSMGGTIVADESYSAGDKDFNAQLTSLKSKNPQAIFLPGYYTEVGLIARQARKLGLTIPLLGGDGWDSEKLWEIGGEALNGCFYSNHYSVDDTSSVVQNFVSKFKARYEGKVPDAMAALGFDAAMVLVDAIRRAGTTQSDSLRLALAATQGFQGVTGQTSLDADRNAVKPAVVLEVRDGKTVFVGSVAP
jgi:branched-chain amino acid transport system substrate-binding protein